MNQFRLTVLGNKLSLTSIKTKAFLLSADLIMIIAVLGEREVKVSQLSIRKKYDFKFLVYFLFKKIMCTYTCLKR